MNQGENAFSGRTLDEKVVNPFLQSTSIPCSKGPYLSVLRRSIRLVPETASGLRDRKAYNALLEFLDYIEIADQNAALGCLRFLHYHFIALRESARIAARKYFAQGHDISFLQIKDWLIHLFGAFGIRGRKLFVNNFLQLLNEPGVPASLKVAWNDRIKSLF